MAFMPARLGCHVQYASSCLCIDGNSWDMGLLGILLFKGYESKSFYRLVSRNNDSFEGDKRILQLDTRIRFRRADPEAADANCYFNNQLRCQPHYNFLPIGLCSKGYPSSSAYCRLHRAISLLYRQGRWDQFTGTLWQIMVP